MFFSSNKENEILIITHIIIIIIQFRFLLCLKVDSVFPPPDARMYVICLFGAPVLMSINYINLLKMFMLDRRELTEERNNYRRKSVIYGIKTFGDCEL